MTRRAHVFTVFTNGQSPHLSVVARQGDDVLKIVSVPLFHFAIFAAREEQMSFGDELKTHDAVFVGKDGSMTVAKIQTAIHHLKSNH